MAKLRKVDRPLGGDEGHRYQFECPGCGCLHSFDVRTDGGRPSWQFDGDMERPTVTPSIHYTSATYSVCHFFLTAGKLQFLPDCQHAHAGRTVELPEIEDEG
ncbi:DUF6527 family protein [Singulisphaera rosea]